MMNIDVKSLPVEVIDEIRDCVLQRIEEEPDKYHPADVKRFNETNELIYRFLIDHLEDKGGLQALKDNISSKVSKNIVETLSWRHEFGVNSSLDSDFPQEFYNTQLFLLGERNDGSPFIVMNIRKLVRLRQWSNVWMKFIVHEMEKIASKMFADPDFLSKPKPHVLSDASEIGLAHIDFSFIFAIIPIFLKHYPQGFQTIWLYELPYFSRHMKGIVLKTLPSRITKKIMFSDKNHIVEDMGAENLPAQYFGTSKYPLKELSSKTASTLREVGRNNNISEHEIDKMIAQFS